MLLQKLIDPELVKEFPNFYGHRMFVTVITTVRN